MKRVNVLLFHEDDHQVFPNHPDAVHLIHMSRYTSYVDNAELKDFNNMPTDKAYCGQHPNW